MLVALVIMVALILLVAFAEFLLFLALYGVLTEMKDKLSSNPLGDFLKGFANGLKKEKEKVSSDEIDGQMSLDL